MTDLIKLEVTRIGDSDLNSVNARDLWKFVESKRQFGNWIKDRIENYGFKEDIDYIVTEVFNKSVKNPLGGRPTKDYIISIHMAKELAMVENNQKGHDIRRYFIEIEELYNGQPMLVPNTTNDRLRLIAEQALTIIDKNEIIDMQADKLKEQAPLVDFANEIRRSDDVIGIREFAKIIGTGEKRLFAFLRDQGIIYKDNKGVNMPYQVYIERGLFVTKELPYNDKKHQKTRISYRMFITGKGQHWLHEQWKDNSLTLF